MLGSISVLQLCENRPKRCIYLSSLSVLSCSFVPSSIGNIGEIELSALADAPSKSGYAQTKFVAESLFNHASSLKLNVIVFRLGMVSSHSENGYANGEDWFNRLLLSFVDSKFFGRSRFNDKVELIPVDWTAKAIAEISKQSWSKTYPIYNITNDSSNRMYYDDLGEWLKQAFNVKVVAFHHWVEACQHLAFDHPIKPLLDAYRRDERYGAAGRVIDVSRMKKVVGKPISITKQIIVKNVEYLTRSKPD